MPDNSTRVYLDARTPYNIINTNYKSTETSRIAGSGNIGFAGGSEIVFRGVC